MIWQRPLSTVFSYRRWPGESIVYNCNTGDTHFLGAIASDLFFFLDQRRATTLELSTILATSNQIDLDQMLTAHVKETLQELRVIGLVELVER